MTTSSPTFGGLPARGILPELSCAREIPEGTDILLVPATSVNGEIHISTCPIVTEPIAAALVTQLNAVGFKAKAGSLHILPASTVVAELPVQAIAVVGLGEQSDGKRSFSRAVSPAETARRAFGSAARALPAGRSVAVLLREQSVEDVAVALCLGAYHYPGLRTAATDELPTLKSVVIVSDAEAECAHAAALVESVACARDLVNTPSSHLYPESYADFVRAEVERLELDAVSVEVLDEKALQDGGYGGLCAVGKGSARGPRLVRLVYSPENSRTTVALVGKGVTFDTGGISIKRSASMSDMISDMGGSAAMIATVLAAARLELPVSIIATIPMAENMPDGVAYRPGDVVTHYGGKTSEIHNTDAEGRLILVDAIVRACEDNPDVLIDSATLTGAQLVALGARTSGVMGDEKLGQRLVEAGDVVGEPSWYMPIPEEIAGEFTSPSADVRNIGTSRNAGMMQAGYFLGEFVKEGTAWAHIDIAGPAYNTSGAFGYVSQRGTGVPVRTLVEFLRRIAADDSQA